MALLILIITPLIAALLSLAVRKKIWPLEVITAIAAPIELIAFITAAFGVVLQKSYTFDPVFSVDALGIIVLSTIVIVSFAASFYSIGYLKQEVKKQIIGFSRVREYFIFFHLFLLAMFFAVTIVSPILMWLAIEATTLSTAFLISFYNKPSSIEAAWKYLIINSIGLLLGFFGTLLFLSAALNITADKFVNWQTLLSNAPLINPLLAKIAFVFVLVGYGTKAGLVPMHTWLPDAHSKASPPISALLSGALLNVAILTILRYKSIADIATGADFSQNLLISFGVASIAIPTFIILIQKNYKRLFAYSSIEHIGIMTLGFGFGGIGIYGALLHMVYHSLAKSTLFFAAGNIFLKYSSTKIANVKGILTTLPITGIILLLGFLAIVGMPPFGIFITEFYILTAGITNYPIIVAFILILLGIIFIGFLKHIADMVLSRNTDNLPVGESNILTVVPAIFLLSLFIVASFFLPTQITELIQSAAALIK